MSISFDSRNEETSQLLTNLENRINRIESVLNLEPISFGNGQKKINKDSKSISNENTDKWELQIGQFWFAKTGIVILALGIIFLLTLPYESLSAIVPCIIGYVLMSLLFGVSYFTRNGFGYISKYIFGGSLLLLYFSTLRLYYFGVEPVIESKTIVVSLLTAVVIIHTIIGIRKQSVYLTGIAVILYYVTAIISDNSYAMFIYISAAALLTTLLNWKYGWNKLLLLTVFATYFFHLNWFLNNPLLGNKLHILDSPVINLFFIILYAIIFNCGIIFGHKDVGESTLERTTNFLISFGGFGLFLLISALKFQLDLVVLHLSFFVVYLCIAALYWVKKQSQYSTFFYSTLGYASLSVAIIAQFTFPNFFVWLCWQSLIITITAIWFRSRTVIVSNFIIYLSIFFAHFVLEGKIGAFTLSYGIVALLNARILNWQKEKLQLKTELMRNAYLAVAFFVFPYTLYNLLPSGYVVISWIAISIIYYLLSIFLKNNKYRWMALSTLMLTVGYLLLIGTTQLDPVYRVVSFLILGLALLGVSITYTKRKSKIEIK